ncbi:phage portal protein [Paenibacillus sp. MSJ-34]|uniref:phage portal protein n=1 Tax=Paenibacillus sp. MSJ-34 TaxID=2841529 RepID=UPI001C10290E|nr:phage portal protein [Paenibacillus sp. MSJ-34]MBU5445636.1 phage portal protein [Paenibacillus sp. MSJ-34]
MQTLLKQYINKNYNGERDWFIQEVSQVYNQQRTNQILDLKQYLSGQHKILNKPSYTFNGKEYVPKKIVLQLAKTMVNFTVSYLLSNPITLTGDETVTKAYQSVYKRGRYNSIDFDILDKMCKFGFVVETIYIDQNKNIQSKLLDPADSYPVYDSRSNYIAMIEYYTMDNVDYYTVYTSDTVEEWTNEGGNLKLDATYNNVSGLPIVYHNQDEISNLGRSDLLDMIPILDNLEDLISKTTDAYNHYLTGLPILTGQQLKGDGLPKDIVSAGLVLEYGSSFDFKSNPFDHKGFESIYKTLSSTLLDIANVPAVSMSKTDISNLSEVSIRLLFSLADTKGALNAKFMREGMDLRFDVIRKLLELKGIKFDDDKFDSFDYHFHFARPSNDKEVVENLKILREIGAMSQESTVEDNPYINDAVAEMDRLRSEGSLKIGRKEQI